jgi:phosphoenolpyruvate carboxykinase (GTP)
MKSNPNAMLSMKRNSIFTNVAHTQDNDVWWEEMTDAPPGAMIDWQGHPWTAGSGKKAAHPNARFTAPARQCPVIDAAWQDPRGVPIAAILFGGRRASVIPLVNESLSWRHGTFLGSIVSSEMTAAAAGKIGVLRRDPMAMLPFCGYHMGDYFAHWLEIGATVAHGVPARLPKIFYVNWFRKSAEGKFLWPGYGENSRVLKWVFERVTGPQEAPNAVATPIGRLPAPGTLDLLGLTLPRGDLDELLRVDLDGWRAEVPLIREHFAQFGTHLPAGLAEELADLEKRLAAAK